MNHYIWHPAYEAALAERRTVLIEIRIAEAENALLDRLEDDLHGRCVVDSNERLAIDNARKLLNVLRSRMQLRHA